MEIKDILFKVVEGNDLTKDETYYIMDKIMKGDIDPAQAGAFLTALRIKGETITEIAAAAKAMRDNGTYLKVQKTQLISLVLVEINHHLSIFLL